MVKYKTGLTVPAEVLICTATVATDDNFTCGGHIPSKTSAGAKGPHIVQAKGATSGIKATTTFTRT